MPVRNQDYFLLAGSKIALSNAATHLNMIHSWATHKAGTKKSGLLAPHFVKTQRLVWEYLGHGLIHCSNPGRVLIMAA